MMRSSSGMQIANSALLMDPSAHTFDGEAAAEAFLLRLRDAAASDEVAIIVMQSFTESFRAVQEGVLKEAEAKQKVVNLLIDEEPTMIDEFLQLFDACCNTYAWAGQTAPDEELPNESHMDIERGLGRPISHSHSGIERISSAPGRDVGTVAGQSRRGPAKSSRRSLGSRKGGKNNKLDWLNMAKRLVPEGRASYAIWFTIANISIIVAVFAYMAGDYAMWVKENRSNFAADNSIPKHSDADAEELLLDAGRVPNFVKAWLDWKATWQTFSFEFLKAWGGRWGPALDRGGSNGRGSWWLWVTSIYIHQNLNHIISNLLLFVAMSVHLELNYGWWRLMLVWFVSGIGANLVSAAFENTCTLLVGASGAVFGFMGLFVADLVVNFESISWPFLRVMVIVLFVVFFIINALADTSSPRVSHASHIGGLVCGLFPSLLFLPNIRNKRIRALQRQMDTGEGVADGATTNTRQNMQREMQQEMQQSFWTRNFIINPLYLVGGIVVIVVYIILPIWLYTNRLKGACCPADTGTKLECASGDGAVPPPNAAGAASNANPAPGANSSPRALLYDGLLSFAADPWGHLVMRG